MVSKIKTLYIPREIKAGIVVKNPPDLPGPHFWSGHKLSDDQDDKKAAKKIKGVLSAPALGV